MKTKFLFLGSLLTFLSSATFATSPALPTLDKDFKFSCTIDLGVVNETESGQQKSYDTIRGSIELSLKDGQNLEGGKLAEKIQWKKWEMEHQREVPTTLAELPGKPTITKASFIPVGGLDGHLRSYQFSMEVEFLSQDRNSKISVQQANYTSTDKIGSFGTQTEANASQKFAHNKIVYSLEIVCGAQN